MSAVVLLCLGDALGGDDNADRFLATVDLEANDGHAEITFTDDEAAALHVASFGEAMAMLLASPKCHPVRLTDARPNRPLTAWTWQIREAVA